MKRVISLIISIAMIASLTAGLAVTGMALDSAILKIHYGDGKIYTRTEENVDAYSDPLPEGLEVSYTNVGGNSLFTVTVKSTNNSIESIFSEAANLVIDLNGKTLTVSNPNSNAIYVNDGNLTINGGNLIINAYGKGNDGICANKGVRIINSNITINGVDGENAINGDDGYISVNDSSITISGTNIENGLRIESGASGCEINDSTIKIKSQNNTIAETRGISADSSVITMTNSTINVEIKSSETDVHLAGIWADYITIDGGNYSIDIEKNAEYSWGILAASKLIINNNAYISSEADVAFIAGNVKIDGDLLTATNLENYFHGNDISLDANFMGAGLIAITGTDAIIFGTAPDPEEDIDDSAEESDPDVEIDFGYGPVTVKTSNKSIVLNDKKIVEKEVLESNNLFVPFDLTKAYIANTKQTKDFDAIFFNNDVYKYISGAGKGVELKTRFAKADVFKKDDIGQNPVSLHLSDVSEIPGTCATAIQKAAMQTDKVYAQVNYSFVTNGKPTENEAKIYVPVDGPAKVFYLFNEGKIGVVPCENIDGYCVFDRYYDGTYVVVAK